jgi:hypothetical protein
MRSLISNMNIVDNTIRCKDGSSTACFLYCLRERDKGIQWKSYRVKGIGLGLWVTGMTADRHKHMSKDDKDRGLGMNKVHGL